MSLSGSVETLIRSRIVRILLALALIVVGAWAFLPYVAYRIAPTAFVNSELVRVTAPMAGRLSPDLPRRGEIIDLATTVKLVEALSSDRRHLFDLEQRGAVAKDRAELARRQLTEIDAADRDLKSRTESYRSGTIQRLDQEVAEAEAEKASCLAENAQRRDVRSRMEQLARSGYTSQIRSAEAFATQEANAGRCEMADARIQRLKIEQVSARHGIFLANGAAMRRTPSSKAIGSHYVVKSSKPKCCSRPQSQNNLPQKSWKSAIGSIESDTLTCRCPLIMLSGRSWRALGQPLRKGRLSSILRTVYTNSSSLIFQNENLNRLSPTRQPKCD